MIRHFFTIAFRNLIRSSGFSAINIFGLAAGMTICGLIMLYVVDELGYDQHHRDSDRIYRLASETSTETWVAAPAPLAEAVKKEFPEVEESARLLRFPGTDKALLTHEEGNKQFFETNAFYVDSTFFDLFTYDFKFGDFATAMNEPNSIVISESIATRLFGDENPIDRVLKVTLSFGAFNYTIKGVFRETGKSHIPGHLFLSMANDNVGNWVKVQMSWAANSIFHTYIKLRKGSDPVSFNSKIRNYLINKGGDEFKAAGFEKWLFIQPLEDIYLRSNFGYEVAPNGNINNLYIFGSIAAFVLFMACINFMNLSTARSEKRATEVGIRKVSGSDRQSLILQFLGESLLMSGIALLLTFVFTQLLIPLFNELTNKNFSLTQMPAIFVWLTLLALITGVLAGVYPAFFLSSFKPAAVLKGGARSAFSVVAIRQGLVVFQFSISITLILVAILISQQMEFMSNRNLGFDKHQKIILSLQTAEAIAASDAVMNALRNNSQITSVARAGSYPGVESVTSMLFRVDGRPTTDNVDLRTVYAEPGYIKTLGIELLYGRDFAAEFKNDQNTIILNEAAAAQFGFAVQDAVGRKISFEIPGTASTMEVIGVVRDYHFQGLQQQIKPLALTVHPLFVGPTRYVIADVNTTGYAALIESIAASWKGIVPNSPFAYSFLDQDFQRNYEKEQRTSNLVRYFSLFAILIACLGLFGLATFTAEQRVKEIGIRKVLGAGVFHLVAMLSKDFLKLVVMAIVLSSPVAFYVATRWLESFAYRIDVQWWVFVVAGLAAIVVALLTTGFQAMKASLVNPVESLRSE
jgi:putative ABC transport system permease protein